MKNIHPNPKSINGFFVFLFLRYTYIFVSSNLPGLYQRTFYNGKFLITIGSSKTLNTIVGLTLIAIFLNYLSLCKTSIQKNVHTPPHPLLLTDINSSCMLIFIASKITNHHIIILYKSKSLGMIKMKCVEDKRQVLVRAAVSEPQGVPLRRL